MTKEQMITTIMTTMEKHLNKDQINILSTTITQLFVDIEINEKKNEISVELDDSFTLLNHFLACKKINGTMDTSLKSYKYTLIKFIDWSKRNVRDVDTNLIRAYLLMNQKNDISMVSCDNIRRYINGFFEWLAEEDYIQKNPCKKIPRLKEPKHIKKAYSDLDMEKLRDCCNDKRSLALIDLLLCTGIRIGEIGKIKLSDVNFDTDTIIINGKGNKQREVYMSVRAKKHIIEYLEEREKRHINSSYLFCREHAPYDKQLSNAASNKIFKDLATSAGIPDCTVHCIRRYVATSLSEKDVPVNIISTLLGHSNCSITTRYYIICQSERNKNTILKNIL